MLSKICFGIFLMSFLGTIIEGLLIEGLLLQKNMNSFIMLAATGTIMILAIIIIELGSRVATRTKFRSKSEHVS